MMYKMGDEFEQDGDTWRVMSTTEHFIIATRSSVVGEPIRASDVIKVSRLAPAVSA